MTDDATLDMQERNARERMPSQAALASCTPGSAITGKCVWFDEQYDDCVDASPMPETCTDPATHYSCCFALTPCLNVCEKHKCRCKQPKAARGPEVSDGRMIQRLKAHDEALRGPGLAREEAILLAGRYLDDMFGGDADQEAEDALAALLINISLRFTSDAKGKP